LLPNGILGVPPFVVVLPFAVFVGIFVLRTSVARDGVSPRPVLASQLVLAAVALAGAKMFSLSERGWEMGPALVEMASGWRYPGGLIGMAAAFPIVTRTLLSNVSLARYADWMAPTIALTHAALRISCFMTGCCTGGICHEFWCLPFPRHSAVWSAHLANPSISPPSMWTEPVFPLHFALLLAALAIGLVLLWFDRRRSFDGQTFLLFLALHEGAKYALEFTREPPIEALQTAALIPMSLGLVALAVIWVVRRLKRSVPSRSRS
jgi:phosphatidylglycerol---prolipoprotein diacylglyceryl transferase